MDFEAIHDSLIAQGYAADTADAKIAHDVILEAIKAADFRANLTVKGGVVMSGLTNMVRRATMDMDVDFLHYSIAQASVRHFIAVLNRASECKIQIEGPIVDLKHQDYKGKRLHLKITDKKKQVVRTKLDIGVHTWADVEQSEMAFKVVTGDASVSLQVNPNEQIFIEKLKSLVRIGPVSTRYKDVYDLYYLMSRVRRDVLRKMMVAHIYGDKALRERNALDVAARLTRIFDNKRFVQGLKSPNFMWLDVSSDVAARELVDFVKSL